MSSENTKLWDILGRTDPKHTQKFTRGGGFKGTAIKPIWSFRRMTEEFGPCGIGWGVGEPSFQVVPGNDGEVLVYCTASIWYRETTQPTEDAASAGVEPFYGQTRVIYGVGGDKVVAKFSSGLKGDDEAFKKAFTDAVTNALKLLGVGADVHMGLFDDSKYVNSMAEEFNDKPAPVLPPQNEPDRPNRASSASLKRSGVWEEFRTELAECNAANLTRFAFVWSEKAEKDGWPKAWRDVAHEEINKRRDELRRAQLHPVDAG